MCLWFISTAHTCLGFGDADNIKRKIQQAFLKGSMVDAY